MGHHFERKCREHEYKVNQGCDLCFYDIHESDLLQYWGKQKCTELRPTAGLLLMWAFKLWILKLCIGITMVFCNMNSVVKYKAKDQGRSSPK